MKVGGIKRNSSFLVALLHLLLIFCNIPDTNITIMSTSPGTNQEQQKDNVASRMTDPIDFILELVGKSVQPAQKRGVENAVGRH